MPTLARLLSDRRGGAVIEFAVLGPVLLTMMLGAVDVGRMFYVRQNLEYATEQAARYYMLNPTAQSSAVTTYLQGAMGGGVGSNVNVSYTDTANCNGSSNVTCTMISATYSFSFIAGYLGLGTKVLHATAQAVRINA
jgi:Flp pilus assembly protein TadG